jgi:small nuclear ribonucleoprotein E
MISRRRLQKIMTLPINLIFRYLQSGARVVIWLYDRSDLRIEGKILGFDEYMNLVLDEAEEIRLKAGTRRPVGRIMLKGDNISVITPAEVVASSSN